MKLRILVTGAGGFIGHHLCKRLKSDGHFVRGIDLKHPEFEHTTVDEFILSDLRYLSHCVKAVQGIDYVYHLAADMGGIGYITSFHSQIARNNTLINLYMLEAVRNARIRRFLFSSSACVYPSFLQETEFVEGLKEEHAIPADPEPGYGWEKLYMEQLCDYYGRDHKLDIRSVRFHNVYGPFGTYDGGKEKSPAAICRKVAKAQDNGIINVWGDGEQTRSYMYIDDCVEGLIRLMNHESTWWEQGAINLGTEEQISINQLVDIIAKIAGKKLELQHDLSKPQGVRGRNSDNGRLRQLLNWEPQISLESGLRVTFNWINEQVRIKENRKHWQAILPVKQEVARSV